MIADLKFGPHGRVNKEWYAADAFKNKNYLCYVVTPAPTNNYQKRNGTYGLYTIYIISKGGRGIAIEAFKALDGLTAECVLIEMEKKYNGDANKASVRATNNEAHPHQAQ